MVLSIPDGKCFIRLTQAKALLSTRNTWECHTKTIKQVQAIALVYLIHAGVTWPNSFGMYFACFAFKLYNSKSKAGVI